MLTSALTSADSQASAQASVTHADSGAGALGTADWVCIAFVLVLMAAFSYHHSHNHIFWSDEIQGWLVLRDKSFLGMVRKWQAATDSGSLFYIVAGRWWMQLFGPSEVSLRAFSATGIAAAFVLLWLCARRFFSFAIVALCLPFLFFCNTTLNWQYSNGRMYGAFFAAGALVAYAFLQADPARPLRPRTLVLTFFAHFFLMSAHILGPLYSGVFIAGLVAQDLWARTFRPRLYLSALAGWCVLLVSFQNLLGMRAEGKGDFWTVRPTPGDFLQGFYVWGRALGPVLATVILLAVVATLLRPRDAGQTSSQPRKTSLYFLLACFYSALIVAYVASFVTTPMYFNRYLLPVLLADALLLCECADRIQRGLLRTAALRYAGAALATVFFAYTFVRQYRFPFSLPRPDYTANLLAQAPAGVPIVFISVGKFMEVEFYHHGTVPIAIPIDDAQFPLGIQLMQRWKNAGYYAGDILPGQEILARYPDFLLVDAGVSGSTWLQDNILHNPQYIVSPRGEIIDSALYLVRTNPAKLHPASH